MTVRPAKTYQPGHPPSLIRVFAVRSMTWVAKDFFHANSEVSDQTGRIICLAHMPFCWFCHEAAQMQHMSL